MKATTTGLIHIKLQKQVDFLEANQDYVICYHNANIIDEKGNLISESKLSDELKRDLSSEELVSGRMILTLTMLFRNVIQEFPDEFFRAFGGDKFLTSLLGSYGKGKYLSDIKPSAFRVHTGGINAGQKNAYKKSKNHLSTRIALYQYYDRIGKKEYSDHYLFNEVYPAIEKLKVLKEEVYLPELVEIKIEEKTTGNQMPDIIQEYYSGDKVDVYESKRKENPKWTFEEDTLDLVLEKYSSDIKDIIDAPVGTGRFMDKYKSLDPKIKICGLDYSPEMLRLASERRNGNNNISFVQHDMINVPLGFSADLTICYRFLNLFDWDNSAKALTNLLSATRKISVFTVRLVEDDYDGDTFIENKIHLHKRSEVEKVVLENDFSISEVFEFSDAREGQYSVLICKKNYSILSSRINKNFKAIYTYGDTDPKGKIYQVKDNAHAKFIEEVTNLSELKQYFPKVNNINDDFIDAEWIEGELVDSSEWVKVIEKLVEIQKLQFNSDSSFDYVEDLVMRRFKLALPIIGDQLYEWIITAIKGGADKYEKKVSHPDIIPGNILHTQEGYMIIDNELMCYTPYHRIDILNTLNNLRPANRENVLIRYLELSELQFDVLEKEYNFLQALWLARQVGSFIVKEKVQQALSIVVDYLNDKNILPFQFDKLILKIQETSQNADQLSEIKSETFQNKGDRYYFGMTSHREQDYFEMYTNKLYTGVGEIVDLGSWFGATTIKLAKGLASRNDFNISWKIHAFDRFMWKKSWEKYAGNCRYKYEDGESFLLEFEERIAPWKSIIKIHAGDLKNYVWNGGKIEFLLVDAMKDWKVSNSIIRNFFPSLIPNKSYVVHQDYKHYYTSWIHLIMFELRNHFEIVTSIPESSSVVFKC